MPPPAAPPPDLPSWSEAPYVRWSSLGATGERFVIIDVAGGPIERALADPDVTTALNDRFAPLFLHPRARPALTERLGYPSATALDGDGCVRAHATEVADAAALLDVINAALRARHEQRRAPPPERSPVAPIPAGGGVWTLDDPAAAAPWFDPARGAPAVLWDGRPWVYGNRADAAALAATGHAGAASFVVALPAGAAWHPDEGPQLRCPLGTASP